MGRRYPELHRLARLHGIQTAYFGTDHRRRTASPESLLAVLRALGAPVDSFQDVPAALRGEKLALARQVLEPVNVITDARDPEVRVCLPAGMGEADGECRLEMEGGGAIEWRWRVADLTAQDSWEIEGERYLIKRLSLPQRPAQGYHRLILRVGELSYDTLLIAAPEKTYQPPEEARRWGAFLPLYALRTGEGWGGADYPSLGRLAGEMAGLGGSVLGTLPLLPVFLDRPFEPSPYAPVSRLLWNEFYVDVTRAPGFGECARALALLETSWGEIDRLDKTPLVDYHRLMALKRRFMEELCRSLPETTVAELERFARENPAAGEYACFRAVMEAHQASWPGWPPRPRDGDIRPGDYDEEIRRYHLYAQWLASRQVGDLAAGCRKHGVKLYFDLPLGVHPDGYDIWRHRDAFARDASGGAPPDSVYTRGQNWGFPPLHPDNIRQQGYRYVIDYLRHHLRYADMLRIDHMMGLHRLFWVPRGMGASQGVYVRYRPDEFYAILALESHRQRCVIVGEDLGTVPPYMRPAMKRHGVRRMFILQYAFLEKPLKLEVPPVSLAALNTHDMPPFAAFWQDDDFADRLRLGLLDGKSAAAEKKARGLIKRALLQYLRRRGLLPAGAVTTREVLRACMVYLGGSRAGTVLVNLEDLWLETAPQNVPSRGETYPCWRRKARYTLEEIFGDREITGVLETVCRSRKGTKGK